MVMKKKNNRERRAWQRLPLAIPVFVHGTDDMGKKFVEFATAINISAGGAQLAIRRYLQLTSPISLEIPCSVGTYKTVETRIKKTLPARILSRAETHGPVPMHLLGLKFNEPLLLTGSKPARRKRVLSS